MRLSSSLAALAAIAAFLVFPAPPTHAQYMYLDANGDGVHTAADVLPSTGVTTADVWLVTDKNRDGSPAVCTENPAARFTINSYEVVLHADGGTVSYGAFQNAIPEFTTAFGAQSNDTDLYFGIGSGTIKPPGTYRLGRVEISIASGAPSISIARSTHLQAIYETAFGCMCDGLDYDNTMKLGSDWQDADGLNFTGSPWPYAPAFTNTPRTLSIDEGSSGSLSIAATDADSDSLTLTVEGLPPFASFMITASSRGQVAGRIDASPGYSNSGRYFLQVTCDDGVLRTAETVELAVKDVNKPPTFDPIPDLRVLAGAVVEQEVIARDPESQPLTIRILDGPAFVTIGPTEAMAGASRAILRIAPSQADVGISGITLSATDGTSPGYGWFTIYAGSAGSFQPIAIDSIPDFAVAEGDTVQFDIGAHDPYVNPIYLDLTGAPRFVWLDQSFTWPTHPPRIVMTPGPLDAGEYGVTLQASEGYAYDGFALPSSRSFHISVANRPFPPQVQTTPEYPCVQQGEVYELVLQVSDPDDDPFTATFGPPPAWGTFTPLTATSGRYTLAPTSEDSPRIVELTVSTVDGAGQVDDRIVPVTLGGIGDCPRGDVWASDPGLRSLTADAGGPYVSVAGTRIRFNGSAAVDPIGTLLYYEWTFGDGSTGLGKSLQHAYAEGGTYRAILATRLSAAHWMAAFDTVDVLVRSALDMRAFQAPEETPIVLHAERAAVTLRMERVGEAYALEDIDPTSLCLWSPGHGDVDSIFAQSAKGERIEDRDRNGVPERVVAFAREDIRRLFSKVRGKRTIAARLEGRLPSGARVRAPIDLQVLGAPPKGVAIWPNPLNPRGTISFQATRPGRAVVRLYDVNGRLVRTLLDGNVDPGEVQVPFDGLDSRGRSLGSGVYFYNVTCQDGEWKGRATILK